MREKRLSPYRSLALLIAFAAPAIAKDRIGIIDFFGYKGLDIAKVREALPVREGSVLSDQTKDLGSPSGSWRDWQAADRREYGLLR